MLKNPENTYALGIDVGSSAVKVSILDGKGEVIFHTQEPPYEMTIHAPERSWAEQDPLQWWNALKACLRKASKEDLSRIRYIGIAYQMHGLVCVNHNGNVLRPAIIWCDSRAIAHGEAAYQTLGSKFCLENLLNHPGNFTASKLKWVKEHEPYIYSAIDKILWPGDYISMKLTGLKNTTITALSEGVMWNFRSKSLATSVLETMELDSNLIPEYRNSFANHGSISSSAAQELGISKDAIVSYKAGDQPNNALSLHVLQPGEVAATAGTSGVIYGVVDKLLADKNQRVNSFAHINYRNDQNRIGVLLCLNGVGISYAWLKKEWGFKSYEQMNEAAHEISEGSEGVFFFPFGNGAERIFGNKDIGASIEGLHFASHSRKHVARAVQEGIAYAFHYGMETFSDNEIVISVIKVGLANMFLSSTFCQIMADVNQVNIELYETDGSTGAARGAFIGSGAFSEAEAFESLKMARIVRPNKHSSYPELYEKWKKILNNKLSQI